MTINNRFCIDLDKAELMLIVNALQTMSNQAQQMVDQYTAMIAAEDDTTNGYTLTGRPAARMVPAINQTQYAQACWMQRQANDCRTLAERFMIGL